MAKRTLGSPRRGPVRAILDITLGRLLKWAFVLFAIVLVLGGIAFWIFVGKPANDIPAAEQIDRVVYLDQGWHPGETLWYYHADQGSQLLPYDLLVHLEQADRAAPFIDPANLTRFRLLNQHRTPNNPDALPVGFARHKDQVGLTCAACHTTQINYRGTALRIDGGPALIDMSGFLHAVQAAIAKTLADEARLSRFAAAIPDGGKDEESRARARQMLTETLRWPAPLSWVGQLLSSIGVGVGVVFGLGVWLAGSRRVTICSLMRCGSPTSRKK